MSVSVGYIGFSKYLFADTGHQKPSLLLVEEGSIIALFLLLLHPPGTLYLLTFDCAKTF